MISRQKTNRSVVIGNTSGDVRSLVSMGSIAFGNLHPITLSRIVRML